MATEISTAQLIRNAFASLELQGGNEAPTDAVVRRVYHQSKVKLGDNKGRNRISKIRRELQEKALRSGNMDDNPKESVSEDISDTSAPIHDLRQAFSELSLLREQISLLRNQEEILVRKISEETTALCNLASEFKIEVTVG